MTNEDYQLYIKLKLMPRDLLEQHVDAVKANRKWRRWAKRLGAE